jgi:hypothetical protein
MAKARESAKSGCALCAELTLHLARCHAVLTADPPSAALADLRELREATYELLGASEDPSCVDGLFEAWDRARAALAATAFLGGEGEAGDDVVRTDEIRSRDYEAAGLVEPADG